MSFARITVFDIIQRNLLTDQLAEQFRAMGKGAPEADMHDPRAMLSPEARAYIPAPVLDRLTEALASSIANTFLWALLPAALTVVCVLLMSNDRLAAPMRMKE